MDRENYCIYCGAHFIEWGEAEANYIETLPLSELQSELLSLQELTLKVQNLLAKLT